MPEQADVERRFAGLLRQFLAELGGRERFDRPFGLNSSLERDLGLGSLERVELLSRLESELHLSFPDQVMAGVETVGDLLRGIATADGRGLPSRFDAVSSELFSAPPAPQSVGTVAEALYVHSANDAGRPHLFLRGEDGQEQTITYGELARRAGQVAAALRLGGVGAGDRVALMLPTGEDFFYCFMGIQLAQAIPVPIYPPYRADRIEDYVTRQVRILRDAEPSLLIATERAETLARLLRPSVPSLAGVVIPALLCGDGRGSSGSDWPAIPADSTQPALIQYTSGSTSDPKGVLLTHANLLANIRALGQALDVRPNDVGVTWLPLYHDMGLIGCWLLSLYFAMPLTVLSPLEFLSRPERWLWAIHYRRATLSVAPNFAYDLCARKIREESIEGLDLSCLRLTLNGSETVRAETVSRFSERFAPYGFRASAMLPVYGLAESTVALCVPPLARTPRFDRVDREAFEKQGIAQQAGSTSALAFASVGTPIAGHEVRVVDEEGRDCAERIVGHILFRGPSSMAGYFRQPEATAAITHAGWLDSGDLGYRADGELFITGRAKDVILKAGRNLYPQEIEAVVAEVEGIRKGCVAAFGSIDREQGTEKLVVAAETREQGEPGRVKVRTEINLSLAGALGLPADDVVLLAPGLLPKTSSGKLRRAATRQAYEKGTLARARSPIGWQWLRLARAWAAQSLARGTRLAWRAVYSGYCYVLFLLFFLAAWVVLLVLPAGDRPAALVRRLTRLLVRLAGLRLDVEGVENLRAAPRVPRLYKEAPLSGFADSETTAPDRHVLGTNQAVTGLVLAANHASYLDAFILIAALPRHFVFVAKKELLSVPVFRTFLRKLNQLAVERGASMQGAAGALLIEQALRQGRSVMVFPEGTFTRARGLRPFRLGAFKAAADTGCSVCPIAIQGSRSVLPDETWLLQRGPIRVVICPVIRPEENTWREIVRLRDAAFAEILAHCGEPRLDVASAAVPGQA